MGPRAFRAADLYSGTEFVRGWLTVSALPIFSQIDSWFDRVPSGMEEAEAVRWVQLSSDLSCPECGEILWVMRTRRAQDRGFYHLAVCQSESCPFQVDD